MNGIGRAPTFHFLERLAEIVQDLTVDNFDLTFRIHDGYETGNAFNRQPKPVFARAHGLLGALTIVNLHRDSVPLEDISLLISKRYGTSQKPAVFPIRCVPHSRTARRWPTTRATSPSVDPCRRGEPRFANLRRMDPPPTNPSVPASGDSRNQRCRRAKRSKH